MAQFLMTLLFTGVIVFAARLLARELARPLVHTPACWDDMLYDALCDGRGGGLPRSVPVRTVKAKATRLPQTADALA